MTPDTTDQRKQVLDGNVAVHAVEAARYDSIHAEIFNGWEQRMLAHDLHSALARLGSGPLRTLDVGCGTGNVALKLWRRGHYVDGVDLSSEMLARLRRKQPEGERLRLHCLDADTFLQSDQHYDLISFSSVLHHLPDYRSTLERCAHRLNQQGVILIVHEPLPPSSEPGANGLHRAVSRAGALVDEARRRLRGVRMPEIDYGASDVHVDAGISPGDLGEVLEDAGMRIVAVRRYRPERAGFAALLNNVVLKAAPTQFSLMAQRIDSVCQPPGPAPTGTLR